MYTCSDSMGGENIVPFCAVCVVRVYVAALNGGEFQFRRGPSINLPSPTLRTI